jgi:hypothetical protein
MMHLMQLGILVLTYLLLLERKHRRLLCLQLLLHKLRLRLLLWLQPMLQLQPLVLVAVEEHLVVHQVVHLKVLKEEGEKNERILN